MTGVGIATLPTCTFLGHASTEKGGLGLGLGFHRSSRGKSFPSSAMPVTAAAVEKDQQGFSCRKSFLSSFTVPPPPTKRGRYFPLVAPGPPEMETAAEWESVSDEWMDLSGDSEKEEEEDDVEMPLPGEIVFRRSAAQSHREFRSSLERLGLSKLSSEMARSLALSMGLPSCPPPAPNSTPVVIDFDASKENREFRLDGIVRTAIGLRCNRCSKPIAEKVFANFSLLLTEKPFKEPSQKSLGIIMGLDPGKRLPGEGSEEDEMLDLDLDDKLFFPRDQKEIDITWYIRDTVHLEIPIHILCSPRCRGRCFDCGIDLNKSNCNCSAKKKDTQQGWSPFSQLKQVGENVRLRNGGD